MAFSIPIAVGGTDIVTGQTGIIGMVDGAIADPKGVERDCFGIPLS